jgi:hypothetical protein
VPIAAHRPSEVRFGGTLSGFAAVLTRRLLSLCLTASATSLIAACAGDLDDPQRFMDAAPPPVDAGKVDARTAPREAASQSDASCSPASAENVPKDVFVTACATAGCHNPVDLAGSLDLKSSGVASRLVGVQAHDGPGVYVATDGDPTKSDLYLLLTPSFPFDNQMPLGQPPLDAPTLGCVRAWIELQAKPGDGGAG